MALLCLLLALLPAQAAQPAQTWEEEDRFDTRFGVVLLEKAPEDNPTFWRITLNAKTIAETEFDKLGLWELFEGDDGHDYVIFRRDSGGIACPYQFRVMDVSTNGLLSVSEEFGTCLDPKRTQLYGSALVLDMDAHIPHPELLTQKEIRDARQRTTIYTVRGGKITERSEVRK